MPTISNKPLQWPHTILVDGQEKQRYWFTDLRAGSRNSYRPLVIQTKWVHLKTGDYAVEGLENLACIERKTLSDLFGSVSQKNPERRARFKREHERMSRMMYAAVVIEANLTDVFYNPPQKSGLHPMSVFGTMKRWQLRYGVPWLFCGTREFAEFMTFHLLDQFIKNHKEYQSHADQHRNLAQSP